MEQTFNALQLNEKDNVAVALRTIKSGEMLSIQGVKETIKVKESIAYGHKIAISFIDKEEKVIKYGECMGMSTEEIPPGYHVHVFNVRGLKNNERLSTAEVK
ncbi:UxaA family hydrolase [Halobacillus naozhouensis]|uniref:UxaA family hydrolase n=1 Tax=Halobacillus naozhouensis TaxID=554880 RepID=A0ABY8J021_9BACI|nr:UxaA family hydrolase [Halobacillus naozhouensis]WFT74105.1 UxaA family hydrolase [Halobacillus naozhouensis]